MPTHWTYGAFEVTDDLEQGDVLEASEALKGVLNIVHPHFTDSKYLGFLILSQSCDLVLRNGKCAARHISIGVIRPLNAVLVELIEAVCEQYREGVFYQNTKGRAVDLLSRVFNQNEASLGIFYLHPDADIGIAEQSVALLRVSVALRSEHYEVLKQARTGRLNSEFRNKLGWLVGNLFSRVGTPDWQDQPQGRQRLKVLISDLIDDKQQLPMWIEKASLNALKKASINPDTLSLEDLRTALQKHPPPTAKGIVVTEVLKLVGDFFPWLKADRDGDFPLWEAEIDGRWRSCDSCLASKLNDEGHPVRLNPEFDKAPDLNKLKQRLKNDQNIEEVFRELKSGR